MGVLEEKYYKDMTSLFFLLLYLALISRNEKGENKNKKRKVVGYLPEFPPGSLSWAPPPPTV